MKKTILLLALLLILTFSLAGTIGDRCEYPVFNDSECDDSNNIYCVNYVCAFYDGVAPACFDTDGDNKEVLGVVNYISRDRVGNFLDQNYTDYCSLEGNLVDSCEGIDCNVVEFFCIRSRTINYSYKNYFCENGCSNGICLPTPELILPQIGDVCLDEYNCEESSLYCVNGFCATEPEIIIPDANDPVNPPEDINTPDMNEPISSIEFPLEDVFPSKSVDDQELLEYIDQWANGELTNNEIQIIIEIWKNK